MQKLTYKAPVALDKVITLARIQLGTKGKALKKFVDLALADTETFDVKGVFDGPESKSCTLTISAADYERTMRYRTRYTLTTKTTFFPHALRHGATIWLRDQA